MPDVFISYSRKDKEFVSRLKEALEEHEREAWLDTKDIEPSLEWLKEIYAAIEKADSFVFIISPEVLGSDVCQKELNHAVKHHKRLIPVVRRDVDPKDVPDLLARLHWIFCREGDDFNQAFQALLNAIATDFDHVRVHTRLLLKALEWEGRDQEKSLLLRGGELKRAEEWLATGRDREPGPTPLMVQFLVASRQAETSRQRRTLSAVALGLVVAVGLAVAAFYQYRVAYQRGRIALSRQLAAQSSALLDRKLDLALLLSLEANRVAETSEAKGSLMAALMHKPEVRHFLRGNTLYITCLALSPGGKMLASGSLAPMTKDKGLIFWDLFRDPLQSIAINDKTYSVNSVAFSPDCKMLAIGGRGEIILWDTVTHRALDPTIFVGGGITGPETYSLAFHPDGKVLASGHEGLIFLWDLASRQLLKRFSAPDLDVIGCLAFTPNGKTLVAGGWQKFMLWDSSSGKPLGVSQNSHQKSALLSLSISPDGKTIATAGSDQKIMLWDLATFRPLGPALAPSLLRKNVVRRLEELLSTDIKSPVCATISPDGRLSAWASGDNSIVLWDIVSRKPLESPLTCGTNEFTRLAFSHDGKFLASGGTNGEVLLWGLEKSLGLGEIFGSLSSGVLSLLFSPDGKTLATIALKDNRIFLWDVAARKILGNPLAGHENEVFSLAFSRDGKMLASGGKDNAIILWDAVKRQPFGQPEKIYRDDIISGLVFGPDQQTLVSGGEKEVNSWNIIPGDRGYQLESKIGNFDNGMSPLASSKDGKVLAFVQDEVKIILRDMKTFKDLSPPLEAHKDVVMCLSFSPDGKTLASGSRDKSIILWDVTTFKPLGPPIYHHSEAVTCLAFSPNGSNLASGSADETIILWDVAERQPIGTLVGHKSFIFSLAFSSDGKSLFSGGWDKNIIRWNVDFESWKNRAQKIANRNLSREEWRQYVRDEPYRLTCPQLPASED